MGMLLRRHRSVLKSDTQNKEVVAPDELQTEEAVQDELQTEGVKKSRRSRAKKEAE